MARLFAPNVGTTVDSGLDPKDKEGVDENTDVIEKGELEGELDVDCTDDDDFVDVAVFENVCVLVEREDIVFEDETGVVEDEKGDGILLFAGDSVVVANGEEPEEQELVDVGNEVDENDCVTEAITSEGDGVADDDEKSIL